MKLTDQEKLALITEAVQDMKKKQLSNFAFCIIVGAIVDQPEVSLDSLTWGAKQLAALREDKVTTCLECGHDEFWGGRCHVVGCGSPHKFHPIPNSNLEVNQTLSSKAVVVRRRR